MIRRKILDFPSNTIIYFGERTEPLKLKKEFNIDSINDNKDKKEGQIILCKI